MHRQDRARCAADSRTRYPFSVVMSVTLLGLSVVFGLGCATTSTGREGGGAAAEPHPGARLYTRRCGQCHGLYSPKSRSRAEWRRVLPDMAREAGLSDAETKLVSDYLLSHH